MRLNQYLARAGLGSRRSVEQLITAGRVAVNGQPGRLTSLVEAGADRVELDGRLVTLPSAHTYVALNKPVGFTVTREDRRARATVYSILPKHWRRLAYVGRLDRESEGLLLFTDDGELAHRLLRPEFAVEREYIVDTDRPLDPPDLDRLKAGVPLPDGHIARALEARWEPPGRLRVVLTEGKKREVRHMCLALGSRVQRLERVRFGPVRLGDLASGAARALSADEIAALRKIVSRAKKKLP